MTKIVRQEKALTFNSFLEAVRNENPREITIDVEDFNFPETIEIDDKTYRKKWLNNRRVYIYVD